MSRRFLLFLVALFLVIPAHAGFFLEKDAAIEEQKALDVNRGFGFGAGSLATYYLGDFDLSLSGLLAYRFQNDLGVASELTVGVSAPVHEAGLALRAYLGEDGFVDVGVSGVYFKKEERWRLAPRIFVDYGRNMKPWPHAHFALQGKIRLGYLIGESLGREQTYVTKTVNTTIAGELALVFF